MGDYYDMARSSARRQNEKKKLQQVSKPKRWSHQDELDAMKGQRVTVTYLDSGPRTGILLDADQFTLKLQAEGALLPVVIFKSVLTDFYKDPA